MPGADVVAALAAGRGFDRSDVRITGDSELIIRLDPLTAPRRTRALATLCDQLTQARACYPGTSLTLTYQVKNHPGPA